ncbi:MAG: threonine aldolase family protein, partial [Kiloniellales bacterium]
AATLADAVPAAPDVHNPRPAAVSITQASEAGTLYGLEEIAAIAEVAKARGLALQMDGARFANAVAALGCSPAEASWKAGVEVLALGATKNGCLAAEALIFFRPGLAAGMAERRKRGGHLFSKHRFLAAQLLAYFENELWLKNARHANAQARALAAGLAGLPEVEIHHAVEANLIFARLSKRLADALEAEGFGFYRWGEGGREVRLVCAFDTKPEDVAALTAAARRLTGQDERRARA